jgi:hypothetical protein
MTNDTDDRMLPHLQAIADILGDDFDFRRLRHLSGSLELMRLVSRLPRDEQGRFFKHMHAILDQHYAGLS